MGWGYKKMLKMKDDPTISMKTQLMVTKCLSINSAFSVTIHGLRGDSMLSRATLNGRDDAQHSYENHGSPICALEEARA